MVSLLLTWSASSILPANLFDTVMKNILAFLSRHKVITVIILAVIAYGVYSWFFVSSTPAPTAVQTAVVKRGDLKMTVSGSGQIEADSQVNLKPVAAGDAIEVTAVAVKNDQVVKKGQLIATLDAEDAARSVREAELALKSAKIKMQQIELDNQSKNKDETLIRRAQEVVVSQQQLSLEKALAKLSDYSIRAPFDGIVTGLSVESGDTISQTAVLASVITKSMKAVITLNEVDATKVKVGDTVSLSFNALSNTTLSGKVSKLDTIGVATQGVVSYGAEVTLDEQSPLLKPGMSVTAEIAVAQKDGVLLVPSDTVSYENGKAFVRVASRGATDAGAEQKKEVTVGITDNVSTEIVSGVTEGETLIVSAAAPSGNGNANTSSGGNVLNSLFRSGRTGTR